MREILLTLKGPRFSGYFSVQNKNKAHADIQRREFTAVRDLTCTEFLASSQFARWCMGHIHPMWIMSDAAVPWGTVSEELPPNYTNGLLFA